MKTIQNHRQKLSRLIGARDKLRSQLSTAKKEKGRLRREYRWATQAHALIQLCAQETQEQLRYQLCELPNLALAAVFDDPYVLDIKFELRRGHVEADFWFVRGDGYLNPKEGTGQGAVDIAGMALRPALWSLKSPKNRASMWLDEPFKHLKGEEANQRALAILAEICKPRPEKDWPGIQIVMVADERASRESLLEVANRVYDFTMRGRQTIARRIK